LLSAELAKVGLLDGDAVIVSAKAPPALTIPSTSTVENNLFIM